MPKNVCTGFFAPESAADFLGFIASKRTIGKAKYMRRLYFQLCVDVPLNLDNTHSHMSDLYSQSQRNLHIGILLWQ